MPLWFPHKMTPDERAQKFHTDDMSLPGSGQCFWLVMLQKKFASTNQKHYPDLGSNVSSVLYRNCIWPAPNVSGFIAQLVEHRTGNRDVTGSNPVEVLNFFQASLNNCINCVHWSFISLLSFHFFICIFVLVSKASFPGGTNGGIANVGCFLRLEYW